MSSSIFVCLSICVCTFDAARLFSHPFPPFVSTMTMHPSMRKNQSIEFWKSISSSCLQLLGLFNFYFTFFRHPKLRAQTTKMVDHSGISLTLLLYNNVCPWFDFVLLRLILFIPLWHFHLFVCFFASFTLIWNVNLQYSRTTSFCFEHNYCCQF